MMLDDLTTDRQAGPFAFELLSHMELTEKINTLSKFSCEIKPQPILDQLGKT